MIDSPTPLYPKWFYFVKIQEAKDKNPMKKMNRLANRNK